MKALFFLFAIALSFQAHAQIVLNPHLCHDFVGDSGL